MATEPDQQGKAEQDKAEQDKDKQEGKLEQLAKAIDPPGREVDERDLKDPGRMTPDAPPVDNRS